MRPVIDLVYFDGCPLVESARDALRSALACSATERPWREWLVDDPQLPSYAQGYGSPSIFVAEREVTGTPAGDSSSACRVYAGPGGGTAPDPELIRRAIDGATG